MDGISVSVTNAGSGVHLACDRLQVAEDLRSEGDRVASAADTFLKISLATSILVAAGSVGYYYAVYLPARDASLDRERQLEKAHTEFARQAEAARIQAEKEAAERRAPALPARGSGLDETREWQSQ